MSDTTADTPPADTPPADAPPADAAGRAAGAPMVLFDLDGTLVDSRPGIASSLRAAARRAGAPAPTDEQVRALIGPPFPRAFVDVLGLDEPTADAMMDAYRDVYGGSGLYDVAVYPGVPDLLVGLADAGVALAVTTSKPTVYAREVLAHIGLDGLLDAGIHGASMDGSVEGKAAVIGLALAAHSDRRVLALVGDRHHDVDGARAHGLPAVGVTWGFGGAGELADAEHVVSSVTDLADVLARLAAATPRG
jgi:phosphoglycolate phosphatase